MLVVGQTCIRHAVIEPLPCSQPAGCVESPHSADGGHSGLGFAWDLWPGGDEAGSRLWAGCL